MSAVNLLPPEIRRAAQTRKLTLLVAAGGGVVLLLIVFFYMLQSANLKRVHDDIAAQQGRNNEVQAQIGGLQQYADLQVRADNAEKVLNTVYADEISFSGIMLDLSRVMPTDEYLTTFSATITPVAAAPPTTAAPATGGAPQFVGSLSFGGSAKGTDTLAAWLSNLEKVKGWVNPWVQSFAEQAQGTDVYTFTSGVDLSSDILTPRGARGAAAVSGG